MEPDLNKYDLNHICTEHPKMSREDWELSYKLAWETFYSDDHIVRLMRRARASGISVGKILGTITWFYGSILYEHVHPLESGFVRLKYRKDRRPGFPIVPPVIFHLKYLGELVSKTWNLARFYLKYYPTRRAIEKDPDGTAYTDVALTPSSDDSDEDLELFTVTGAARDAVEKARRRAALRA